MRALIVEDTDSVQYALRLALEFLGHEVVAVASDGQDALEKYVAVRPDVVMMDVRMPLMDGLTATSRLLRDHDPQAKVIIVTAGRYTATDACDVGARGYVEKPFELNRLDQVLQAVA